MPALLALLLLQGGVTTAEKRAVQVADLRHPARAVRDAAVDRLARDGPSTAEVVAWLGSPDPRLRRGAWRILGARRDPAGWGALVRQAAVHDGAAQEAVAWALAESRPLPSDTARINAAVRARVRMVLGRLRGGPSLDRPQAYRGLWAGGAAAEDGLRRIAIDAYAEPLLRAHALHALLRQFGAAHESLALELADAEEPRVRDAAIRLLWRHAHGGVRELLARRFESDRILTRTERDYGAAAASRLRRLGSMGEKRLLREVRRADTYGALRAARSLVRLRPERRADAYRRLRALLEMHERAGGNLGLALWWLYLGPFDDAARVRFEKGDPLLAAAAAKERADALPLLDAAFADERMTPASVYGRLRVGRELLRRWKAPAAARVAFAVRALARTTPTEHGWGLAMLRGVEPRRWAALLPRIEELLASGSEHVRLEAAALLVPRPAARRVCLWSLADGDPAAARRVSAILARWSRIDAAEPIAKRRERAHAELQALAQSGQPDKE